MRLEDRWERKKQLWIRHKKFHEWYLPSWDFRALIHQQGFIKHLLYGHFPSQDKSKTYKLLFLPAKTLLLETPFLALLHSHDMHLLADNICICI